MNKRKVGTCYEKYAGAYLAHLGYEILEYNFRCRSGEIDIIAKDGNTLVFCEVKFRSSNLCGEPEEAVNLKKQRVISRCARFYLALKRQWNVNCRFDVIAICGNKIRLHQNAFDFCD